MRHFMFFLIGIITLSITSQSFAQSPIKQIPSPLAMVTYKYGNTYVKITYSRPAKKSRVVMGELVPYGKIWRTGANEATEITLTQDVKMGGKEVKAGTYTLFTIPEKDQWTIVLNNELGQWGAFKYNEAQDYIRFSVPSNTMDAQYEIFTMEFETIDPKEGSINLLLKWEKTKVAIPMVLTTGETIK